MLRVDREGKALKRLKQHSLPEAGWKEREDLQQMIRNSPEAFFAEMNEQLLLLGEEVRPTDFVDDRIDLLALDPTGASVIIELKRGNNKYQLLQALSYAAMVSKWDGKRLLDERHLLTCHAPGEVESEIEEFLQEDLEQLNSSQRIILIAEDFDYEVLVVSEWLSDAYEVDVRCYRLNISLEDESEYLSCTCIFPPPELAEHAIRRRKQQILSSKWNNWNDALGSIENIAIADFVRKELETGRENNIGKREVFYRIDGKRRYHVSAHQKVAYVWQNGRFEGDENFWQSRIGEHIKVGPVKSASCLRFFLSSVSDFENFLTAFNGDLEAAHWLETDVLPGSNDENELEG